MLAWYQKQEADEDPNDPRNQLRVVRDIPVSKAVQLVREKIEGIMEGGPDGLRRAFRVFDADMNGAISYAEFDSVMKRRLNLRFEPGLLAELMASFDDTGTGSINYKQFCELVLGSTQNSASSLLLGARGNAAAQDAGMTDMMVRRKIRESYRPIRACFRDLADSEDGTIAMTQLVDIFGRFDIDLGKEQFAKMTAGVGAKQTGRLTWQAFVEYFRRQEADEDPDDVRNKLRVIGASHNMKVGDAVELVREKIMGVMAGGPDGLRRTFRVFDGNMNGSISYSEFEEVTLRSTPPLPCSSSTLMC